LRNTATNCAMAKVVRATRSTRAGARCAERPINFWPCSVRNLNQQPPPTPAALPLSASHRPLRR
jgi:hypothetical protein